MYNLLYRFAMLKIVRLLFFVALVVAGVVMLEAQAATPRINVLTLKGAINPVPVDYIRRGILESQETNAVACIIRLDTPGGLDTAMRDIIQAITNAKVPVVVYVAPSGARAASAGVFITLSAHVAAMAPNTAIGAAHPVSLGEGQVSPEMQGKIVNDAAAYIRGLAATHGRNADWAEKAVRESVSITDQEALKLNVIDLVVPTLGDLITQLDGRKVTLIDGSTVTLQTQYTEINYIDMSWIEDFLFTITEPNIAYILLGIGGLGIMAEILSPGLIFPGVVGAISLLLAFFSLGMLPVNWTGVLLILLAFGLFVAEALTPGFGVLAAGGITSLVIGSLILFKGGSPAFRVDPWLIALVAILAAAFLALIVTRVLAIHRRKATTGREELVGAKAVVKQSLNPEGTVFLEGELWTAVSDSGKIEPGEEVTITKVDGLKLWVVKKK